MLLVLLLQYVITVVVFLEVLPFITSDGCCWLLVFVVLLLVLVGVAVAVVVVISVVVPVAVVAAPAKMEGFRLLLDPDV